jgi:hypothetical protein
MAKKIREQRRLALRAYELWSEVTALENARTHAEKIVEIHPLKAADAMQLGAAIVAAEEKPETLNFVTLDARLAEAAEKEVGVRAELMVCRLAFARGLSRKSNLGKSTNVRSKHAARKMAHSRCFLDPGHNGWLYQLSGKFSVGETIFRARLRAAFAA